MPMFMANSVLTIWLLTFLNHFVNEVLYYSFAYISSTLVSLNFLHMWLYDFH